MAELMSWDEQKRYTRRRIDPSGLSPRENISRRRRALEHAGIAEEEKKQKRRTHPGIYTRIEEEVKRNSKTLEEIRGIAQMLGFQSGENTDKILKTIMNVAGGDEQKAEEKIREVAGVLDADKDGYITDGEIKNASANEEILESINKIHPLLRRAIQDPSFRVRTITPQKVTEASPNRLTNNVGAVEQGYANYIQDYNRFNVAFN